MAWAAIGATALSAYSGAKAAKQQAQAQAQQDQYQAAVAQMNAQVGQQAADYAVSSGEQQAEQRIMQGADQFANNEANYSGSNIDTTVGSAKNVLRDVNALTDMDVMTIRNNAARAAWGYINQGKGFTASAGLDNFAAQNTLLAGKTNVTTSLLSGAGSVADKWYRYSLGAGSPSGTTGTPLPSNLGSAGSGEVNMSMS